MQVKNQPLTSNSNIISDKDPREPRSHLEQYCITVYVQPLNFSNYHIGAALLLMILPFVLLILGAWGSPGVSLCHAPPGVWMWVWCDWVALLELPVLKPQICDFGIVDCIIDPPPLGSCSYSDVALRRPGVGSVS
jgi:hypothetical protein